VPERYSSVSGAKKIIFGLRYGLWDFTFLFLVELGTCVQNLIFTKVVEGYQKYYFPQRGMLKFTYKGRFLTIKIAYQKILGLKIRTVETYSRPSSTRRNFYFSKTLKSRFFVEFQSFFFGQILAILGSFGQNLLHSQWLRACPNLG
jgi:hypothetical protein